MNFNAVNLYTSSPHQTYYPLSDAYNHRCSTIHHDSKQNSSDDEAADDRAIQWSMNQVLSFYH